MGGGLILSPPPRKSHTQTLTTKGIRRRKRSVGHLTPLECFPRSSLLPLMSANSAKQEKTETMGDYLMGAPQRRDEERLFSVSPGVIVNESN